MKVRQKPARKDEVSLCVAKTFIEDEGKGLARLDAEYLESLRAAPGDVLFISGRGSTVARAATNSPEYAGRDLIQIDGITRDNAQVSVDEWCTIKKVSSKAAESILLSPLEGSSLIPKDEEMKHVQQLLSGTYVVIGDKIQIVLYGTRPQFFFVDGASPRGVVRITPDTRIHFKSTDVDHDKTTRVSYEDIGGLEKELSLVREMIELPLKFPDLFTALGIDPPQGVLLSGPPGTGKTLLARTISNEVRAHFIHVNGPEIIHKFYGESEAKLREVFEEARRNAPSIIFLDEIDALAPRRAQVIGDVEKRVVAQLLGLMDGLVSRGEVVIIGATNMPELLDPALRRPGRFDREITIGVPNRPGRLQILKIHSNKMPLAKDVDLDHLAGITHGYVGADISALCKEAGMIALRRIMPNIRFEVDNKPKLPEDALVEVTRDDFLEGFKSVEPTSTREFMTERPRLKFSDVGGLDEIKQNLKSMVELPMRGMFSFTNSRLGPPKGVLFSGKSGTGKTLMARALAGEMGIALIVVDPPTLLSKWVGESEKGLREVFKRAKQASPCILFFDEIEAIASARSAEYSSDVSQRVVSQLFRELDELHGSLGVIVVAATNRVDLVEPALLRAGRFDYIMEFPLPDRKEREEIFSTYMQSIPFEADVDLNILAERSDGWTGAEIEALCKRALMLALEEFMDNGEDPDLSTCVISSKHFDEAGTQYTFAAVESSSVKH